MFKDAIYNCDPGGSDGSDGSDGSRGSGGSGSSRRLAGGGEKNPCVGLGLAYLHILGPFLGMFLLWLVETYYKARFVTNDWFHWVLDLVAYFFLVIAGMNMHKPADYLKGEAHPNRVQIGLLWALMVWIFRVTEIAVLAKRESSRRQGAADLVALLGVLAIWLGAHYAAYWETYQHDKFYGVATKALIGLTPESAASADGSSGSGAGSGAGSQDEHSSGADDASAALLWAGNLYFFAKQLQRPLLLLLFGDRGLGVEQTMAPCNHGFITHRINEFMFLMIGEGVLALVRPRPYSLQA